MLVTDVCIVARPIERHKNQGRLLTLSQCIRSKVKQALLQPSHSEQGVLAEALNGKPADQEIRQQSHRFPINPALGVPPFLFHVDQSCYPKLLDVMGDRGLDYVEASAEVSHAFLHLLVETAGGARRTARDQMKEDCEAVGIRDSLECFGVTLQVI